MGLVKDVQNIMLLDADLLNGEQYLRLEMDFHLNLPLLRLLTLLLDMDLFANKMDSSQLLNQRFYKMENMTFIHVLQYLREFSQLL